MDRFPKHLKRGVFFLAVWGEAAAGPHRAAAPLDRVPGGRPEGHGGAGGGQGGAGDVPGDRVRGAGRGAARRRRRRRGACWSRLLCLSCPCGPGPDTRHRRHTRVLASVPLCGVSVWSMDASKHL